MAQAEPMLDEASLDEVRKLIGVPLRRDRMQFIRAATRDAIRHFADGIADDNPLWRDPAYARTTRWSRILAPPTILYAVDATIVAPKLAGWQWIYAGTRWTWFDVIREGDAIEATAMLKDVTLKSGRRFSSWALQTGEIEYRIGDSGRLLAIAEGRTARTPRNRTEKAGHAVPEEDRGTADVPSFAEMPRGRRGAATRTWESVEIGQAITPLVRGPLTLADIVNWYRGAQGALHYGGAHGDAVRYRRRHRDYEINRETGAKDATARGHFQAREGRAVGMGGAYDVGPQRISWAASMLTDWGGDDSFVTTLDIDVLKPNVVGDTTRWCGRVVAKKRCGRNHFVGLALEARNQRGVVTARGTASLALPSADRGPVALPLSPSEAAEARHLAVSDAQKE